MNKEEYITLLYNPEALQANHAMALGNMVQQYPYLQSVRALYLKALHDAESYRYNTELKKTAAYTTDRSVLFDSITSEQFTQIKQPATSSYHEDEPDVIEDTVTEIPEPVAEIPEDTVTKDFEEIPVTNVDESYISQEKEEEQKPGLTPAEEKLEIGRPLEFVQEEKHSFREWLQLSKITPVNRDEKQEIQQAQEEAIAVPDEPAVTEQEEAKTKKLEIIDRFIEANPKITPVKNAPVTSLNIEKNEDTSYLMTETLARVYLEQKKYSKAIQAYEILILKYPEKSIYFADLISDIKNIQQSNN